MLSYVLVGLAGVVLVVGTLVTGSGPHSGDVNHPARTGFDPERIAWLHADLVVLFVGLVVALLLALHLVDAPRVARQRAWVLLGVTLSQGVIGYVQFFTGVPWVLVGIHVLGAVLVWLAVLRVPYALRTRSAGPRVPAPVPRSRDRDRATRTGAAAVAAGRPRRRRTAASGT